MLEDSLEERLEKTGSLLSDLEKVEGETKEGDLDESKVKNMLQMSVLCTLHSVLRACACSVSFFFILVPREGKSTQKRKERTTKKGGGTVAFQRLSQPGLR